MQVADFAWDRRRGRKMADSHDWLSHMACGARREQLDGPEWARDYGTDCRLLQLAGTGGHLTNVGMHPRGGLIMNSRIVLRSIFLTVSTFLFVGWLPARGDASHARIIRRSRPGAQGAASALCVVRDAVLGGSSP